MKKKWVIELELSLDEGRTESEIESWIEDRLGQDMNRHENIDHLDVYIKPLVKVTSPELQAGQRIMDDFNKVMDSMFKGAK